VPATSELDAVVADAAFYLIPELTSDLKAAAKSSGWPSDVVNALSVSFDGENLAVDYPKEMSVAVDNLEYGTGKDAPNSVIRSFIYRSGDTLKSVLANRSVSNLMELEGVFNG
jgi:hypothetical protein